ADSPVLVWSARITAKTGPYGFFFSAVSAAPYEPFTHWAAGGEDRWPDGWETDKPPHRTIAAQTFKDLPGGHALYYNPKENYGAVDLMEWAGAPGGLDVGARQFYAVKKLEAGDPPPAPPSLSAIKRPEHLRNTGEWSSRIGICFPTWKGTETLLEARAAY